jgi:uncharacterized protein (UPF0147 family)
MGATTPGERDGHEREHLRMLRRAIVEGWEIPDHIKSRAPEVVASILENGNDRERLRAAEVLAAMKRDNVNNLIALDKIERLEDGTATDRIEFKPMEF